MMPMNLPQAMADTIRIVPHSGLQFLTFELDLDRIPRFMRSFIEHRRVEAQAADGTIPVELRPAWNEDDPTAAPPFTARGSDVEYDISKQKALEPFLGKWVPVPILAVQPVRDALGRGLLQQGPTNWARVRIVAAEPGRPGVTHILVLALDTELAERRENRAYIAPSPQDAIAEQQFVFAHLFRDIAAFLSDRRVEPGSSEEVNRQEWLDRWVDELFVEARVAQRGGRALRPEDRQPLEHAARYVAFLQLLAEAAPLPRIKLIDTLSADQSVKPVDVDLVLDIGNSRTCGLLIENFPNQEKIDLGSSYILQLRDLSEPHRMYSEPFESDVQLAQSSFGKEHLSRFSTRARAFFWPSLVRVGPEAARYREEAEGTEGASGMSSPKRYLCDVEPVNQEWRYQPWNYGPNREPPTIDLAARRFVNHRGDVLRQIDKEREFYKSLAVVSDFSALGKPAPRPTFSRSSFFTFLVAEILVQALSLINNPQMRATRGEKDTPRRLHRVIFTLPTAMPVREQRLLRSRAEAAIKLVWDLMGWTDSPPPGMPLPQVQANWDEASCAQFVYLYSEVAQKFGGNITQYFDLCGKPRPLPQPARHVPQSAALESSIRIASIDIGGGTTDLMITTYFVEQNRGIVPVQTFREGFRIAGEDVLREVIQQLLLPAIERHLTNCGVSRAHELLVDRFGADRANMTEPEKHLRRQFVLRLLKPAGLALLSAYEDATTSLIASPVDATLGELIARTGRQSAPLGGRILDYLQKVAADWGAREFRLTDVVVPVDFSRMRSAIDATLGEVLDNIAEALHHFDCDLVLLSGRPSRLPATVEICLNKLPVAPDRLLPLSNYPAGNWYPFGGRARFRIEDPKTATVVGGMLCALADSQITNFTLYTNRLAMRSTANFIGLMERDGKLRAGNVLFQAEDHDNGQAATATVSWYAPMPLGSRQLPIDRWVATPMYRIKSLPGANAQAIEKPVGITLERDLGDNPEAEEQISLSETQKAEARKEELRIVEATTRNGGSVTRSFGLFLDTLASEDGYWLDTGILVVT